LQPILIRPIAQGNFELIAGERRFRAAKLAGLVDVPCVIRDASDDEALALALIENIQREDLSTIEEARALRRLVDEFSLSHAEAGKAVGRSRAAVSNLMRLLELAEPVQALLEEGRLEMGHARALLAVPPTKQFEAAEMVVTKDLTVRQTERLVRSLSHGTQSLDSPTGAIVPLVHSRWKLRLNIRRTKDGLATVTLRGLSQEELGSLLEYLRKG
jgi:ParB family chromosome partitioning protein